MALFWLLLLHTLNTKIFSLYCIYKYLTVNDQGMLYSLAFKYTEGRAQALFFLTHYLQDSIAKVVWDIRIL